jgi:hypothetical protein
VSNLYYRTPYLALELAADLLISVAQRTRGALMDTFRMKPMEDLNQVQIYCFPGENSKHRKGLFQILQSWAEGHQIDLERDDSPLQDESLKWNVQSFWLFALFNLESPARAIPVPIPDQFLAVIPIEDFNQLNELIHDLARNATYTRVAVAHDQDGTLTAIFHLKDDVERDSSLQSLVISGSYRDLRLLEEYSDGRSSIFLLPGTTLNGQIVRPGQRGMELFCLFLRSAGKESQRALTEPASSELLVVILPQDASLKSADGGWRLIDLRSLRFQNQSQLVFREDDFTRVKVVTLKSAPEYTGDTLRLAIQRATPPSGHSLRLRHTHLRLLYTQTFNLTETEIELHEINDQINNLVYRRALIESVGQSKPLLLRFTQQQLPALADYLGTIRSKGLANGSLKYAYHATDLNPNGYHYLWISPELLADSEITRLFNHPNLGEKRIFWLDPFWGRYYPEDVNKGCYVFVPFEMTLFPTMHGWGDEEDMASYLSGVIREWGSQAGISAPIPDQPIYVFDLVEKREKGAGLDQKIHILVLDRTAFDSIQVNLPWINDCLVLHQELINAQSTISTRADAKTQEQLAHTALKRGEELRQQVIETAGQIQQQVNAVLTELTHAFVLQFNQLDQDTRTAVNQARVLNQRLKDTMEEYKKLDEFLRMVEDTRKKIKSEADRKMSETEKLQSQVVEATIQAADAQSKMKEKTARTIQELTDEEAALRKRLDNFRF